MNILDIIIIIFLIVALVSGYRKGIIVQICGIIGLLLGAYLAFRLGNTLGDWLGVGPKAATVINFILVLVVVIVVLWLIGLLFKKVFHLTGFGVIDRIGGALLGFIKIGAMLSVLLTLFVKFNNNVTLVNPDYLKAAKLYAPMQTVSGKIFPYIWGAKNIFLDSGQANAGNAERTNLI